MLAGQQWYEQHMEEFVRPQLALSGHGIPNIVSSGGYIDSMHKRWMSALRAIWFQVKRNAGKQTILLPGRDVWALEILARLEGYPTCFKPEFSGDVREIGRASCRVRV